MRFPDFHDQRQTCNGGAIYLSSNQVFHLQLNLQILWLWSILQLLQGVHI